ncbi:MAG: hypothetical protein NW214_08960 [Pseudanabaenaceae cyanobacterium bins.39]|nr:hypothetical protein [Pseudanabaenaceae cyanobacterium bins.39]
MYQASNPPVDPVIHHQWLEFENRRLKASGDEFQRLFEDIMVRSQPGFMRIRPYGNIGDRKCDGLFQAGSTLYQVYSPDELKQADLIKKIDEDLDGAIQNWADEIQKWIFVYNVKRGLPPDLPSALKSKREQYPNITIESLSNDQLWEIARNLTTEQRTELFGAPYFSHNSVDRQSWLHIALRRSRERCISRWQSIGVARDEAVNLADDSSIGSPPSNLILSPGQLVILIGEMGIGKSLVGDRCLQSLIYAEQRNHLKQTPLFLEASRLQGKGLEDFVRESLQGICNPDDDRTVIIVDSIDLIGITESIELINEARILVGLWEQSTILLISKPTLELNSAEESINLPLLSEGEAEGLVRRLTNLPNFSIKILPETLQDAILRPLYAILLGTYIKEKGAWRLQFKQQLIASLVDRSLRPFRGNIVRVSQLLEQLAANCLDKGGSPVLSNEITSWTERQQLLDSNLVTETDDRLQFPIPMLTQWFASQYLLKNQLDPSFFTSNKQRLELWQAPLAIVVATFPLKRVSEILIPIVENDPISGANIVSEALVFQGRSMEAPPQSSLELAKQIRTAIQAWIKGFKFLASSVAPHLENDRLPTIGVRIGKRQLEEENSMSRSRMTAWIEVAWHVGDPKLPDSVELPIDVSSDDLSSMGWKSICGFPPYLLTSWVWQWTLEQAIDLLLKPRSVPVKQGLLSLEASWHVASKILERDHQDLSPISLEALTNRLSGIEEIQCSYMMRHCFDQLLVEINFANSRGLKWLHLPDSFQSFRNNRTHSVEDLLAYASDVYLEAFEGYLALVDSLTPLIPNLKLVSILPAKLIAILALPNNSDEICITRYWEPLPKGSQNELEFNLSKHPYSGECSSDIHSTARKWMELRPQWWMHFRVETSKVSPLTKFWLGVNPVTDLAYKFLWEDFKRMGWVHGGIGDSGFPYAN